MARGAMTGMSRAMGRGTRVGQKKQHVSRVSGKRHSRKELRERRKQPNRRRQDYNVAPYDYGANNYYGNNGYYDNDYGYTTATPKNLNTNDPAYDDYVYSATGGSIGADDEDLEGFGSGKENEVTQAPKKPSCSDNPCASDQNCYS